MTRSWVCTLVLDKCARWLQKEALARCVCPYLSALEEAIPLKRSFWCAIPLCVCTRALTMVRVLSCRASDLRVSSVPVLRRIRSPPTDRLHNRQAAGRGRLWTSLQVHRHERWEGLCLEQGAEIVGPVCEYIGAFISVTNFTTGVARLSFISPKAWCRE